MSLSACPSSLSPSPFLYLCVGSELGDMVIDEASDRPVRRAVLSTFRACVGVFEWL